MLKNSLNLSGLLNIGTKKDSSSEHLFKTKDILNDFGAKTEMELENILLDKWNIVKCKCSNEIDILECSFTKDGNIVCSVCGRIN